MSNTHCTLVYFYNLKRGFEQNLVKTLAEEHIDKLELEEEIELIIEGKICKGLLDKSISIEEYKSLCSGRCILIGGKITKLQEELIGLFQGMQYDIDTSDRARIPHIDPRGQNKSVILTAIPLKNNWWL